MIYDSGNNMVSEKGPYERFEGPHCPKCHSHQVYDTYQCPVCEKLSERTKCECGEKTISVMVCHECLEIYEEK